MSASVKDLEGKTAIVTGASKLTGIGFAIASGLARRGASVVDALQKRSAQAAAVQGNASSPDFGSNLVSATLQAFNIETIDIIVNCAGTIVVSFNGIADVTLDQWDTAFHTNVRGGFLVIQAALPYIPEGGRILNIGSVGAKIGHKMLPVFSASKAALTALTVSMAEELGPRGITINVIAPGPIATEAGGIDMSLTAPVAQKFFNNAHIKRVGTPEEVVSAAM